MMKVLATTANRAPTPRPKRGSRSIGFTRKARKATIAEMKMVENSFIA